MYTSILLATLLSANAPMRYAPVRGVMYQPAITYAQPAVMGSAQIIMTPHGPVYIASPVYVSAPTATPVSAEAGKPAAETAPKEVVTTQATSPAQVYAPAPVYVQPSVFSQPQHYTPAPMMFGGFSGGRACST